MSELYPTEARATAQNVLFNLGRAVGGFGPLAIGALAAAYSWQVAIALLAAIYVVDMLATALLIPERKGVAPAARRCARRRRAPRRQKRRCKAGRRYSFRKCLSPGQVCRCFGEPILRLPRQCGWLRAAPRRHCRRESF